jgi:hypothetical protein
MFAVAAAGRLKLLVRPLDRYLRLRYKLKSYLASAAAPLVNVIHMLLLNTLACTMIVLLGSLH